jgi:predicted glutamine amidotransferase
MDASIDRNSDGVGAMYVEDGRVKFEKLVFEPLDNTLTREQKHQAMLDFCTNAFNSHDKVVIHHRLKTHGRINEINTHPYKVLSIDDGDDVDLFMMHNGTLSFGSCQEYSDTYHFVENVLRPILRESGVGVLQKESFHKLLASSIKGSKLVFLDNSGTVTIINESDGKWQDKTATGGGCWISNIYSINPKPATTSYYNSSSYWNRNGGAAGKSNVSAKPNLYDDDNAWDYYYEDMYGPNTYTSPPVTQTPKALPSPKPTMKAILEEARRKEEQPQCDIPTTNQVVAGEVLTYNEGWMRYDFDTQTEQSVSDQEGRKNEGGTSLDAHYYRDTKTVSPKDASVGDSMIDWTDLSDEDCVELLLHMTTDFQDIEDFVRYSPSVKVSSVINLLSLRVADAEEELDFLESNLGEEGIIKDVA